MQHLLDALNAAAKSASYIPQFPKDLQLIEQYLRSGDERLMPALLAIPDECLWPLSKLAEALPTPDQWTVEDRRVVRFAAIHSAALVPKAGKQPDSWDAGTRLLVTAVGQALGKERAAIDCFAAFREEFTALGINESRVIDFAAHYAHPLVRDGKLTSAGMFLISLPAATLAKSMDELRCNYFSGDFLKAWIAEHRDHAVTTAHAVLNTGEPDAMIDGGWVMLLDHNPGDHEQLCASAFRALKQTVTRFNLGCRLTELFPGKYAEETWDAAPRALESALGAPRQAAIARWMLDQRGAEAIPLLRDYIANWNLGNQLIQEWKIAVLDEAVRATGPAARPAILAGLQADMPALRRASISALIDLRNSADDEKIASLLETELTSTDNAEVIAAAPMAASWDCARLAPRLWELLLHKSKPVREAGVGALARLGEAATEKAADLLTARKSDTRAVAAALLGGIGTPAAVEALRRAIETEQSETVGDAIRAAFTSAGVDSPASIAEKVLDADGELEHRLSTMIQMADNDGKN